MVDAAMKAIMKDGLWWLTLFGDTKEFVEQCDIYQKMSVPIHKDNMPLRPTKGDCAFAKWGIDFVWAN